jgi:hypothetical protein
VPQPHFSLWKVLSIQVVNYVERPIGAGKNAIYKRLDMNQIGMGCGCKEWAG